MNLLSVAWWRNRLVELSIAILTVYMVINLSQQAGQRNRDMLPASSWFLVNEVYVPDHVQGSDPPMIYDRTVLEEFEAFWIVEVQRKTVDGLWTVECTGSGVNAYEPEEVIEKNTVSWTWFIGKPCVVPPEQYRLRITHTLTRPGWNAKRVFTTSNEFTVTTRER